MYSITRVIYFSAFLIAYPLPEYWLLPYGATSVSWICFPLLISTPPPSPFINSYCLFPLLPTHLWCWDTITPVLHILAFYSFIMFVQSMNHITALKFLIALVYLLYPFPSFPSSTISARSSMPRNQWVVPVNHGHHVRRRRLPHNEPPVSHDDIADVDSQLQINSPRHTSSGDASFPIEHEYLPQPYNLPDNPLFQDPPMTSTSTHH